MNKEPEDQKQKQPSKHVHPDERGRVAALTILTSPPTPRPDYSYYSPELIQCTLPHSDPKTNPWIRKNGNYSLIVSSGFDETATPFGIPYGSFPRLVLAHIITRVVHTRERRIELSSHFSSFLREIGYTSNHKGTGIKGQRVRDQLLRLLNASISFQYLDERKRSRLNLNIAPRSELWHDYKNPDQDSLFGSWIELSEEFFQAILESPVPLRTDILRDLKKSPLAIDIYMWVSYRLFGMQAGDQKEINVHYGSLQAQFGTGVAEANYRQFRSKFKLALSHVAEYWQPNESDPEKLLLNYDLNETGLTLYRSPLLIGRGQRSTEQEAAAQIINAQAFDMVTRKQAQKIAGKWNVDHLSQLYFEWIGKQSITPKDPRAHFFEFIKSHRKLHGETV